MTLHVWNVLFHLPKGEDFRSDIRFYRSETYALDPSLV